jgi:D-glycero-D-manno-heptose 1,7-bisphosphate phosphatase
MKRAAVFFDRDNTLIANDGYLGDPRGVELVHGAADAVARARALGYAVVVFSNQSGVARGMFSEEAVHAVNHRMDEMLLDENGHAVIDRHEFCPFHPEATEERYRQDSDLRKPKPGMILQAERQLALDLPRSWVVGDAPRDIEAGKAAGCRTILVNNPSLTKSPAAEEPETVKPDFEVESLAEAMEVIARHHAQKPEPAEPQPEPAPTPAAITEEPAPSESIGAFVPVQPDVQHDSQSGPEEPEKSPEPNRAETKVENIEPPSIPRGRSKSEILLGQILDELRRRHEHPEHDFSVSKLVAGIVQVLALAAMFYAYVERNSQTGAAGLAILTAIFLQTFTIALLIMGRQK